MKKASYDDGYTLSRISYIYDNVGNISNENITTQNNPNPQTTASPQTVSFGTIYSGTTSNQTVTITNTGANGLSISNIVTGGPDKTLFSITSNECAGIIIPAGGLCSVNLSVTPTSTTPTGAKTATLNITSNDIYNTITSVPVNGVVSYPSLTVTKQGGGAGTISSAPDGISCGNVCNTTFTSPTSVTLTAVPDQGNTFVSWSGDCTGISTTCSVLVDQASNVIATFNKNGQNFAVNLTVTGSGSGSVLSTPTGIACNTNCSALYTSNSNVTLHPAASQYSIFSGWIMGDCNGIADCLLTMSNDKASTATFDKDVAHQVAKNSPLTYFPTVQDAYNAGNNGDVIKLWAQPYNEDLVFNLPIEITIQGGYDGSYTNITGEATIKGKLIIRNGRVNANGLIIQ